MNLNIMNTMEIAGITDTDMRTIPKDLREYCRTRWVSIETLNKRLSSVMNVRNDEKEMRKLIIEIQEELGKEK